MERAPVRPEPDDGEQAATAAGTDRGENSRASLQSRHAPSDFSPGNAMPGGVRTAYHVLTDRLIRFDAGTGAEAL